MTNDEFAELIRQKAQTYADTHTLDQLAVAIANAAPKKRAELSFKVMVPWYLILAIRLKLEPQTGREEG